MILDPNLKNPIKPIKNLSFPKKVMDENSKKRGGEIIFKQYSKIMNLSPLFDNRKIGVTNLTAHTLSIEISY